MLLKLLNSGVLQAALLGTLLPMAGFVELVQEFQTIAVKPRVDHH